MMNASKPRRRGFTLIELLVVIAIIGVLVALLLPSLAGARAQARQVQCASNMRHWGFAIQMYANDENGQIPTVVGKTQRDSNPGLIWSDSSVAGDASKPQLSCDKMGKYLTGFYNAPGGGLWSPAWSMGKVFICPGALSANTVTPDWVSQGNNGLAWTYYMYFGRADLLTKDTSPHAFFTIPTHMVERELLSTRDLMSDFVSFHAQNKDVWNYNHAKGTPMPILGPNVASSLTPDSMTGWNILFGDAHVEWDVAKIPELLAEAKDNSGSGKVGNPDYASFWLDNNGKLFY